MAKRISAHLPAYGQYRRDSSDSAKTTVRADRQSLNSFMASVGDIDPGRVTRQAARQWIADMTEGRTASGKPMSPATVNLRRSLVVQFYRYLQAEQEVPVGYNPLDGIKSRKNPQRERRRVDVQDFARLLDIAGQRHPRDRVLCALGLFLCLRGSESTSLRVRDLNLTSQTLQVYVPKKSEWFTMRFSSQLADELRLWLTYYTERCGPPQEDWYLVPAKSDNPLVMLEGLCRPAGEPELLPTRKLTDPWRQVAAVLVEMGWTEPNVGEGSHTLRRSGARAYFNRLCQDRNRANALRTVMTMLHHSSTIMTERYLGIREDQLALDEDLLNNIQFPEMLPQHNVVALRVAASDA